MIGSYAAGRPAWADLLTPVRSEAMAFYGAIFGWTFRLDTAAHAGPGPFASDGAAPEPVPYTLALRDGRPVAGIADATPSPEGFPAPPTAWTSYLPSRDVGTDGLRIEETGGTVLDGPTVVGGHGGTGGRLLVAADPTGTVFGLWQPAPGSVRLPATGPGAPTWHECVTHAPQSAAAFYRRLLRGPVPDQVGPTGHAGAVHATVAAVPSGTMPTTTGPTGTAPARLATRVAGSVSATTLPAGTPPGWLVHFEVRDVDDAAARAVALGGAVLTGPDDGPAGRQARIRDPQGAVFVAVAPHRD